MTIINSDHVDDIAGVVVWAFNRLLLDYAESQHMLANQVPADARALALVDETRAKNSKLEERLQEQGNTLRAMNEQYSSVMNANSRLRQEVRELKLQLDHLQHEYVDGQGSAKPAKKYVYGPEGLKVEQL